MTEREGVDVVGEVARVVDVGDPMVSDMFDDTLDRSRAWRSACW